MMKSGVLKVSCSMYPQDSLLSGVSVCQCCGRMSGELPAFDIENGRSAPAYASYL